MNRNRVIGIALVIALLAALVALVVTAANDDTASPSTTTVATSVGTLPFGSAPTKATVAKAAGLTFPASVSTYRSVQVGTGELNIAFDLPAADLAAFLDKSNLGTLTKERMLFHGSPVWDQNPGPLVESAQSTHDEILRVVEVVTPTTGDTTIRHIRVAIVALSKGN